MCNIKNIEKEGKGRGMEQKKREGKKDGGKHRDGVEERNKNRGVTSFPWALAQESRKGPCFYP